MSEAIPEEVLDLLVSRATEGLDPAQEPELEALLRHHPGARGTAESLEQAAALTHLALLDSLPDARTAMPGEVRGRLLSAARAAGADPTRFAHALATAERDRGTGSPALDQSAPGRARRSGDTGWWVAAAVALAWGGSLTVQQFDVDLPGWRNPVRIADSGNGDISVDAGSLDDQDGAGKGQDAANPPPDALAQADAPASPAARRSELLAEAEDAVTVAWNKAVDEFASVTGDVVWSNARQEGYLRLAAMPANDPTQRQYQLWIVDPERDDVPVDGGVFDVPADDTGEVIVPINAKLEIIEAAAFAITREQPGGVVVSDGPLLLVAAR